MSRPTPIAFGITELNIGGAEKSLVEIVTRLDPSRWSPSVVSLQPLGPLTAPLRDAGIEVQTLDMHGAWDSIRAYYRWKEILKRKQPAVLVTFLFHANLLGRHSARAAKVPVHVSGIRVAERAAKWHLALDRWTKRSSDRYVCVSQSVADFTCRSLHASSKYVTVIPNGVDLSRVDMETTLNVEQWGIASDELVLVAIGRLSTQKGPDVLIHALARIRSLVERHHVRLVFVGDGPMKEGLFTLAAKLDLSPFVVFVGHQAKPFAWLKRSDGLVLASRWEGMPNVVLEAMAASRAVIATDVDGTPELVVPNETGWLVPPDDPAALADAITDWIQNGMKRESYGQAGRARVEQNFTIEETVANWDRLLSELCDHK